MPPSDAKPAGGKITTNLHFPRFGGEERIETSTFRVCRIISYLAAKQIFSLDDEHQDVVLDEKSPPRKNPRNFSSMLHPAMTRRIRSPPWPQSGRTVPIHHMCGTGIEGGEEQRRRRQQWEAKETTFFQLIPYLGSSFLARPSFIVWCSL